MESCISIASTIMKVYLDQLITAHSLYFRIVDFTLLSDNYSPLQMRIESQKQVWDL
jgi:hypothetical protein